MAQCIKLIKTRRENLDKVRILLHARPVIHVQSEDKSIESLLTLRIFHTSEVIFEQ